MANKVWQALSRRRQNDDLEGKGELSRILGLFDLTALGVGATLGLGVYVIAGNVAKNHAGPAVCISFAIAAIASAFAGLCYAEFASRVPKAGSAYVYSYVTVGEFIAFVIGWNLILEYVIGTASVARGVSSYIDALIGNSIENFLMSIVPINIPFFSKYLDFFAFGIIILLTICLSVGIKESTMLNNIFTTLNLATISVIIVTGIMRANPKNWMIDPADIPANFTATAGTGGFAPFGFKGIRAGAAVCFFAFVGFDTVATTGEEAKRPQRNIPLAIIFSLAISFIAYFTISTVLTMMWPYYDQDVQAPFPYVYEQIGWYTIKWIVNIGAIFALCTSLFGAMFPLPRILYAMASDGIIFHFLSNINSRTKSPLIGTLSSGILIGIMVLFFDLEQLINMMSIGTLLAYTIVAISVLILRYQKEDLLLNLSNGTDKVLEISDSSAKGVFKRIFNLDNQKQPSSFSTLTTNYAVLFFCIVVFIIGILLNFYDIFDDILLTVTFAILTFLAFLIFVVIARQPDQPVNLSFKVPLVPLIPCLSIIMNLYLMIELDMYTWVRFGVWMIIGFSIYFFYGLSHSVQGERDRATREKVSQNYVIETQLNT